MKEKGYELSLIGEDKVEGKKVVGVRVSKKDQKDISLYFDAETCARSALGPHWQKATAEQRQEYANRYDYIVIVYSTTTTSIYVKST